MLDSTVGSALECSGRSRTIDSESGGLGRGRPKEETVTYAGRSLPLARQAKIVRTSVPERHSPIRPSPAVDPSETDRPRLLYVITRSDLGGAQVHLLELLRHFRSRYEVALAVGEEAFLSATAREEGIPVFLLRHLRRPISPIRDIMAVDEITRLLRTWRPSLLHAHSSKAGIVARIAAWRAGVPAIFTAHGWAFTEGVPWHRRLVGVVTENLAGRVSSAVIAVSDFDRRRALAERVLPASKLHLVRNGIALPPILPQPETDAPLSVLMVARFGSPKDQPLLLRALSRLRHPWELHLLGDGPRRRDFEDLVGALDLAEKVHVHGNRRDVERFLRTSHVVCLPSDWEGLPLSLLEAMAAGRPVVASDVGGIPEAVDHEKTGLLVPRGDEDGWVNALERLATSPSLRRTMGRAARLRVERMFSVERMLEETARVYAQVLGSDRDDRTRIPATGGRP